MQSYYKNVVSNLSISPEKKIIQIIRAELQEKRRRF